MPGQINQTLKTTLGLPGERVNGGRGVPPFQCVKDQQNRTHPLGPFHTVALKNKIKQGKVLQLEPGLLGGQPLRTAERRHVKQDRIKQA